MGRILSETQQSRKLAGDPDHLCGTDLTITDFTAIPVDPNSGSLLNVSMTVKNEGTRTTRVDSWSDRIYLSRDQSLDSYDIFLGSTDRKQSLAPGETYTFTPRFECRTISAADTICSERPMV